MKLYKIICILCIQMFAEGENIDQNKNSKSIKEAEQKYGIELSNNNNPEPNSNSKNDSTDAKPADPEIKELKNKYGSEFIPPIGETGTEDKIITSPDVGEIDKTELYYAPKTLEKFKKFIQNNPFVIVYFSSDRCSYCDKVNGAWLDTCVSWNQNSNHQSAAFVKVDVSLADIIMFCFNKPNIIIPMFASFKDGKMSNSIQSSNSSEFENFVITESRSSCEN